jgi:hypothetical protein
MKKQSTPKALKLNRESLRHLQPSTLGKVAGGGRPTDWTNASNCCPTNSCPEICFTWGTD